MYLPFEQLPDDARLWVYQADRALTPVERAAAENNLHHLCDTWSTHGTPLHTSFRIEYNQFIILAVDERHAGASGCSIDGTVRLLKSMQERLGIDFFNRQWVAFADGDSVHMHPLNELKSLFEKGILTAESLTFNNTVTTKADWQQQWRVPARESWLSRYLPKAAGVR
jgi:hypothetical protein